MPGRPRKYHDIPEIESWEVLLRTYSQEEILTLVNQKLRHAELTKRSSQKRKALLNDPRVKAFIEKMYRP